MTDLDGTLAELAKLRGGTEPIVTLYLDVRWRDEQQRERVRGFVQDRVRKILGHYADGTPGRDALARTLAKVRGFVEGLAAQAYEENRDGVALFACESLGLWRPLFFARTFPDELVVNGVPHLSKLARVAVELAPAAVVVPTPDGADIYEVRLGELEGVRRVHGPLPAPTDKSTSTAGTAGTPGRRYERDDKDQRRSDEWIRRDQRAAATVLTAFVERSPHASVVLVGPARTVAGFERELPERVAARVTARVPRPRGWGQSDGSRRDCIRSLAEQALRASRSTGAQRSDGVLGEALRGGLGVVGPDDVVLALNEGRVHTLVIEEDLEQTGWRCDNCGALGADVEAAEVCPFCGGDLRAVQALREALVAKALAAGGEVEIVGHQHRLHSYRGVAALLRQTAPTGMRGATPRTRAFGPEPERETAATHGTER
jgi:hypothetical protein